MRRREYSEHGIYHIMVRGNRKEKIFIDDEDRYMILNFIEMAKKEINFILYAYCLMGNHDHLLIKELNYRDISSIMEIVNTEYARFFNNKYGLIGHVQQDRFRSEIIDSEAYLLNCIRYIHNNPVKAKITQCVSDYKWSSDAIYRGKIDHYKIVDKDELYSMLGGGDQYNNFMEKRSYQVFLEPTDNYDEVKKEYADMLINDFFEERKINLYNLNRSENKAYRNELIIRLREEVKLSSRIISKILDINYDVVRKVN